MNRKSVQMGNIATINVELVPTARAVTAEDRRLFPIYIQILDLDSAGKCWKETTRKLLAIDPDENTLAARRLYDSYLVRAKWMCETGIKTICSDKNASFEHWVVHILKSAIEAGKILKPETQNIDQWAHEQVRILTDQNILQPDPNLSQKACEKILLKQF
ncbi:hypothetical protein [Paremcibacter congregatus]|uniref:hypothetical protein n=1 Tax=Paremcibacter congregatus TaxID=2043170 RepID=UPI0030EDCDFC|tara:strand:+ start:21370 stop:21849 length:480 start_codon:yes stop_codon:yes gene_type:complete